MKKIKQDTFTKFMMIFVGVFFVLVVVAYGLIRHFLVTLSSSSLSLDPKLVISLYNAVWIDFFVVFIPVLFIVSFLLHKINSQLEEDISAIKLYVKEISEHKNYTVKVKIKYYQECLETSIYLKNIAKRLSQKEKKTSKK